MGLDDFPLFFLGFGFNKSSDFSLVKLSFRIERLFSCSNTLRITGPSNGRVNAPVSCRGTLVLEIARLLTGGDFELPGVNFSGQLLPSDLLIIKMEVT